MAAVLQLVHRALLTSGLVEGAAVGAGGVAAVSVMTVGVKSEEEEAARAISTLAVAAAVA